MVSSGMYSTREQVEIPWAAGQCDLLHVPHSDAPLFHRGAMLVSIHDLTHILDDTFRATWKSRIYAQPMLRLAAGNADHIFTVSEYSKRRIIEHLGVRASKVTVVYNGVSPQFFPELRDESRTTVGRSYGFEGPYVLYVGNLKSHKDVAGLISAFAALRSRRKVEHKLLIIGGDTSGRSEIRRGGGRLRAQWSGGFRFAGFPRPIADCLFGRGPYRASVIRRRLWSSNRGVDGMRDTGGLFLYCLHAWRWAATQRNILNHVMSNRSQTCWRRSCFRRIAGRQCENWESNKPPDSIGNRVPASTTRSTGVF